MKLDLGPLSPSQTKEVVQLKSAYGNFWRRFSTGYKVPSFSRKDVEGMLTKAAEIVVRIRSYLDKVVSPAVPDEVKKRILAGSCQEFLFKQEANSELPMDNPDAFLRGLVHATFQDSHGYVEGLSAELVDSFISQVKDYDTLANSEGQLEENLDRGTALFKQITRQWERCQTLMAESFSENPTERNLTYDQSTLEDMASLKDILETVEQSLRAIRMNRMRTTRSAFLDPPDTPFLSDHPEHDEQPHPAPTKSANDNVEDDAPRASTEEQPSSLDTKLSDDQPQEASASYSEPTPTQENSQPSEDISTSISTSTSSSSSEESTATTESTPSSTESQQTEDDTTSSSATSESQISDDSSEARTTEEESSNVTDDSESKTTFLAISKVADHVDQVATDFKQCLVRVEPLCTDEAALSAKPMESLQEIERYHSTILGYSEDLLQDLLHLDELEVDPQSRLERKKQVIAIQSLMDDLDGVASKLKKLKEMLKAEVAKQAEEEKKSRPATPPQSSSSSSSSPSHPSASHSSSSGHPPQSSARSSSSQPKPSSPKTEQKPSPQRKDSPISSLWERMKLDLEWEKKTTPQTYIIRAFIPGLDTQKTKIELSEDSSAFTISGTRCPSQQEELELRHLVRRRYRYPPSEEDALVMQLGHGKYGSFKNTFSLPQDAIPDKINASYERGILQIEVPRVFVQPQPKTFQRPYNPFGQYYGRRPGFFDDRDIWW